MQPFAHLLLTYLMGQVEPEMVLRQIKIATATGNAAALQYRVQKFIAAQLARYLPVELVDLVDCLFQVVKHLTQGL